MLFVMGVGFLLDSPLIVFHSMCVFRLWSQCPSRCSFHMPDLCVCMAWLMSLFKCSSRIKCLAQGHNILMPGFKP